MSLELNDDRMRRLALVRHLINQVNIQNNQPGSMAGLSILPLQDAVELFLQIIAEAAGASIKPKQDFLEYWTVIEEKGFRLPSNAAMKRLNQARVSLKHHGNLPDSKDIQGYVYSARKFIDTVAESAFGFGIDAVSMVQLVSDEDARTSLLRAEEAFRNDDFKETVSICAVVMRRFFISHVLMAGYRKEINSELSNLSRKLQRDIGSKNEIVTTLSTIVDSFAEAISLISLSVKIEEYTYFKSITPIVHQSVIGTHQIVWRATSHVDNNRAEWCINFTVNCLMRLEERAPFSK